MTKYQEIIEELIKDIKSRLREFGKENSVLSINFVGSFGGENHVPTWKGSIHRTPFHLTNKGSIHRTLF